MNDGPLFTQYPDSAGYNNRPTSKSAAATIDKNGNRNKQLEACEEMLLQAGVIGLIAEEARQIFIAKGYELVERGQANARLSDACAKGIAVATERERKSTVSGRNQMIVVHKNFATPDEVAHARQFRASKRDALADDAEMVANFLNGLVKSGEIKGTAWAKRVPEIEELARGIEKELRK